MIRPIPTRFRIAEVRGRSDPRLIDPQNWNEYWDRRAPRPAAVYDAIAGVYRNMVIRRRLEATLEE